MEAIEILKQMAGGHTDEQIATTLNRLGFKTGAGHTWNEQRVYSARHTHDLPAYDPQRTKGYLTLEQAAQYLGVSANSVRRMIKQEKLRAEQVVTLCTLEDFGCNLGFRRDSSGQFKILRMDRVSRELKRHKRRNLSFQ